MAEDSTISFAVAIAAWILVVLFSIPGATQLYSRFFGARKNYQHLTEKYEDVDGSATEESEAAFSSKIICILILIFACLGFAISLASSILATGRPDVRFPTESWLQFAAWIFVVLQAASLFTASPYQQRSKLGLHAFFTSVVLIAAVLFENLSAYAIPGVTEPSRNLHVTLTVVQIVTAFLYGITSICIPRRPDVFYKGNLVDGQNTVSILGRLCFSWTMRVLARAGEVDELDVTDMPYVPDSSRAATLEKEFAAVKSDQPVWRKILKIKLRHFLLQWSLAALAAVTNFLPQIVLYVILQKLEERDAGYNVAAQLWILAVALGASLAVTSWIESSLYWNTFANISIPVLEQLAAVIFAKSTRRKDVKGVKRQKQATASSEETNGTTLINEGAGPKEEDRAVKKDGAEEDEEDDAQKTKQSTINLIAVDAKRVSDFCVFNYIFISSAVKLVVAIVFLVNLIGWIPLLCGFVIPVIIIPVNILAAKRYAAAQDKLMKVRDTKMAVVTEALQGIRQIKFSALEKQWQKKIMDVRTGELKTQWTVFIFDTTLIGIWILGPVLLAAVSLTVYALMNKGLSASVAFTTISVFDSIEMVLAVIPELVTDFLDAKISAERITKYLRSAEKVQHTVDGDSITFKDVTVAWPSEDGEEEEENRFQLRNLDFTFPNNELSVISGKTGSGKSLLLSSILGESDVISGTLTVPQPPAPSERHDSDANKSNWIIPNSIAFVAQIPWIENATIKDNILFGLPEDVDRYNKVTEACALRQDLDMLEDGDMTDIGANGINLSGGQKWRVSFARAMYSRAGILILDDIFSAVDTHVGRQLYEQALTGELGKGRTRILVTHHVALCLPRTKYSVLLGDGTIQHAGTVEELRRTGSLKAILDAESKEQEKADAEHGDDTGMIDDGGGLQRVVTNASKLSAKAADGDTAQPKKSGKAKKFTEAEKREKGAIRSSIYKRYIKSSGGYSYWAWITCMFLIGMLVTLARSGWITLWTRSYQTESTPHFITLVNQNLVHHTKERLQTVSIDHDLAYYLGIYVAISVAYCIIGTARYFFVFWASLTASRILFEDLTYSILRAPLRWLDTVPVGRILNRFTADFNMLDSRIAMDLAFMSNNLMNLVSVIIAGFFVSPWMILFAVILLAVCLYFAWYYLKGAREVKRLESTLKSPLYELFGSTLVGIGTIRAFDSVGVFVDRMFDRINNHARALWHVWLFNRWMGFRLNMAGAVFSAITALLIVNISGIDAPLAGFALAFSLEYTSALTWALRMYANLELDMNAAERIVEYAKIQIEKQEGDPVPAAWPTKGSLDVSKLVVGYAPELPAVLKGLTFAVDHNQRVGVVGRTGAGKSSLTLALFRFLEAREGSIHIDGIDISKISLYDLRSRLAIIPQDPVLFSGTVRSNLDAFDEHDDQELRDALERVHLVSSTGTATPAVAGSSSASSTTDVDQNKNIFSSLSSKISEGGLNLSQGQRQLLCLARAIVSRPKIMVLDEATSAVDMATDTLIQRSIREEFTDSTLVVIAHRLSTIADFDKILVMGDGKMLEYDTPAALMKIQGGVFRSMVEESGEPETLEGLIFGTTKVEEGS